MSQVGVVAIGRNEGERLDRCLRAALAETSLVIYVDSNSSDDSVARARALDCEVVELPPSAPFTAARARNAGLSRLLDREPGVEFVQFVDGDCELAPGWIAEGVRALEQNRWLAVVAGRRRERWPEQSIYNRLCDIEWNTPVGPALACGGDALYRVTAFQQAGGFDASLIAGEEPELCVRLRARGWKIERLAAEMTRHDANLTRFAQWWRRTKRAGHAYAEGAQLHGRPPERHWVRESRSIWLWGGVLPLLSVALAWPSRGASLGLLAAYLVLGWRVLRSSRRRGLAAKDAWLYTLFTVLGKAPQFVGQVAYHRRRLVGRQTPLIEYREPPS